LLTISTSSNGFTAAAPQFNFQVGGTSSLGGASTFKAYGGNSNTLFDTSNQLGSTLVFPTSPFSGVTTSAAGTTANPYALTIVATLNGIRAGSASFNAALDSTVVINPNGSVPEPATMALLGAVLLFSGSAIRRKLRRTAA
jgi:hypothetical protein